MKFMVLSLFALGCLSASAVEKPAWVGNDLGKEALSHDYVDPNFPPLQIGRDIIISGFKRLISAPSGLPKSIEWRDFKMLRERARLEVPGIAAAKFSYKLAKVGKNGALGVSEFTAGKFKYTVSAEFDFDFTVHYIITVAPVAGTEELDHLSLVFPLNLGIQDEKLVMYRMEGAPKARSGEEEQKERVYLTVKGGETRRIAPGFCDIFWVGNTHWGMSLNFESARGWNPVRGEELVFDPASGLMSVNFIAKPTRIGTPVKFEFYLTPTPIRTMPKNWRAWNYGWRGSLSQKIQPDVNQLIWWSSTFRFPGKESFNTHWLDDPEKIRSVAAQDRGMHKAAYSLPQFVTPALWWEDKNGEFYLLEDSYLKALAEKNRRIPGNTAKKMPEIPADTVRFSSDDEYRAKLGADFIQKNKIVPSSYHVDVVWTPELVDHFVWGIWKRIQLGIGGIYFDGLGGSQDYSPQGVWTDPDGKQRPSFHFDKKRVLFKRARALVKRNDPDEFIVTHMSGTRPLALLSLCDGNITGETFFYGYHPA